MFSKINKINSFLDILVNRGFLILIKSIVNLIHLNIVKRVLKKKLILKRVNEYKMYLLTNDNGISRSLILFGRREEDQKYILSEVIEENMNIFDIGANIGYYSVFFSKRIKSGKILAIEPSSNNIALCRENISLNKIDKRKIFFLEGGVSDTNTTKDFYLSTQSNLHTLNPNGSARKFLKGEKVKIKTFSVKTLSEDFFVPDLIRMDVEGHECEIIAGMIMSLKKKNFKPHICFEPHIDSYSENNNFANTLKKLSNIGYFTKLISSNAESGTKRIIKITNKEPELSLQSDGEIRSIFRNIKMDDTINILTKTGGARTVLLSPKN